MIGRSPEAFPRIAIVGGGFTGTAVAIALLRLSRARVTLIERRPERLARGLAYGAATPDQLLNVRAASMSAVADDPGHFERWLDRDNGHASPFVRRRLYGLYLRELLADAEATYGDRLQLAHAEVVDVTDADGAKRLHLRGGGAMAADAVVLASGNAPAPWPDVIARGGLPADRLVDDPWAADLPRITDGQVLLIGSGLTAVDVALALADGGFGGRILMLSRRGLLPRSHDLAQTGVRPPLPDPVPARLSALLAEVRRQARTTDWRNAVDALRPVTQDLWAAAGAETRRRFLRHLRPWWDVHRHRLAPEVCARVETLRAAGRLRIAAGRIESAAPRDAALAITWRERGGGAVRSGVFDLAVNCSGVGAMLDGAHDPLLATLGARGVVRADPLALGIDCDAQLRVIDARGRPDPRLFCLGPLTRGQFWETTAVPDIRQQAVRLVETLAAPADRRPGLS